MMAGLRARAVSNAALTGQWQHCLAEKLAAQQGALQGVLCRAFDDARFPRRATSGPVLWEQSRHFVAATLTVA